MSELLHDIEARIQQPDTFVEDRGDESAARVAARAVCQLFESAEPVNDSILKPLDLPGELQAAARVLRQFAEERLDRPHDPESENQSDANRFGFLANVVEQTAVEIIPEPARLLQIIIRDRDRWQQRFEQEAETHALTMAAMQMSQESNLSLAQGQSKIIGILERIAKASVGHESAEWRDAQKERPEDGVMVLLHTKWDTRELARLTGSVWWTNGGGALALSDVRFWRYQPPAPGETTPLGELLTEIHALLNQVTAIEADERGRLVTAEPRPEA